MSSPAPHPVQVARSHYLKDTYLHKGRWMSYYYQVHEIAKREDISSLLDVGPGISLLRDVLAWRRPDIEYRSVDIAEDLSPDIIGDVTHLPLKDDVVDCACAFQVLEHLPFEQFDSALAELARVSRRYVIISLPHFGPSIEFEFKLPLLPRITFGKKVPYPKAHTFTGEHYWEIGKRGYPAKRIRKSILQQFEILDEFVPREHLYHRFYILKKRS